MMRSRNAGRLAFAVAVILSLSWTPSAWAQPAGQLPDASPPADLVFGEEIDVRVVNVEVVVEDRDGNRVEGLSADDFRILVDGEEVAVDYFTEILENRAVASDDVEAPPAIGDGELVPTNYLFFVDDNHTFGSFRRPVLRGFAARLSGLGLRDQVAVVVRSGPGLEVLSPFTADREQTREALEELDRGRRFMGSLFWSQRTDPLRLGRNAAAGRPTGSVTQRDIAGDGAPDTVASAQDDLGVDRDLALAGLELPQFETEAQSEVLARELEFSITAVVSTMRAMEAPNGRKVLLLLAGGWPTGNFRSDGQGIGLRSDLEILDGLIDAANLLGYTIYPMDQQAGQPSMTLWQNLRYIARDTGGKAYMAGTNLDALARVSADTANYYWLGFTPQYRRDDQGRDIRVEVLRPGLRARSRRGYLDLSRRAEADMEAQRVLLFPSLGQSGNEPALRVDIGAPERHGVRQMKVPVTVFVPVGLFPALPYEDMFLVRLELRFAVVDRNGEQAGIPLIPLDLRGRSRPAPDAVMPYSATLTLRRRPHSLVVSIHDPLSKMTVSARTTVAFK